MLRGCAKGRAAEACALSALQNGTASERAWSLTLIKPTGIQEMTEQLVHDCTLWDNKQLRFCALCLWVGPAFCGVTRHDRAAGTCVCGVTRHDRAAGTCVCGVQQSSWDLCYIG